MPAHPVSAALVVYLHERGPRLVSKLRHARDRKSEAMRKAGGPKKRIEGRKPAHVLYPQAVREAKRLRRASPKTGERRSFRTIAAALAKDGHLTKAGKPFTATAVKRMVEGPAPAGTEASLRSQRSVSSHCGAHRATSSLVSKICTRLLPLKRQPPDSPCRRLHRAARGRGMPSRPNDADLGS